MIKTQAKPDLTTIAKAAFPRLEWRQSSFSGYVAAIARSHCFRIELLGNPEANQYSARCDLVGFHAVPYTTPECSTPDEAIAMMAEWWATLGYAMGGGDGGD